LKFIDRTLAAPIPTDNPRKICSASVAADPRRPPSRFFDPVRYYAERISFFLRSATSLRNRNIIAETQI
jgi:hypothetical protein